MQDNKRIGIINSLRGVAVLMVIWQHFPFSIIPILDKLRANEATKLIFDGGLWGAGGVALFCILSGFVLYKPYLLGEREFNSFQDIFKFYKHRFLRLYPLLIIFLLVAVVFIHHLAAPYIESALLSATTLSQYTVHNFWPLINGALWTLAIEIWFSLVFPYIVILIKKFGFKNIFIAILIISLVVRLWTTSQGFQPIYGDPARNNWLARVDDLLVGMLIAKIYFNKPKFLKHFNVFYFVLGVFLFCVATLISQQIKTYQMGYVNFALLNNYVQISFAMITLYLLNEDRWLSKILNVYPLQYIGIMCYSLYIWHIPVMNAVIVPSNIKTILLYPVVLLILSFFSYNYIEMRGKSK